MEKLLDQNDRLLYEYLVNNNEEAFKQLIIDNLNLISLVLNKIYSRTGKSGSERVDFHDEYYSYGYEGLVKSIEMYDRKRIGEAKFSTYACIWIESKIKRQISKDIYHSKKNISFETPISEKGDVLAEVIASEDNGCEEFEEKEYNYYKRDKVLKAMELLNEKDRRIVDLYFGFSDGKKKNQQEVAEIIGISKACVSISLRKSCAKLEKHLKEFRKEYNSGQEYKMRLRK